MIAGAQIHPVDPKKDCAAHDQAETDNPDIEQNTFDEIVSERADHGCRQEGKQHAEDEPPRRLLGYEADRDLRDAGKIDRQQGQDGAELNQYRECLAEFFVIEAEEALHQKQVTGGRYRQEFGQSLDHAEDECLEKIEEHGGLRERGTHEIRKCRSA